MQATQDYQVKNYSVLWDILENEERTPSVNSGMIVRVWFVQKFQPDDVGFIFDLPSDPFQNLRSMFQVFWIIQESRLLAVITRVFLMG